MSVIHVYKVWPSFFGAILIGDKTFEVRKDDRDPAPLVGDWLELREYEPGHERYTDRLVRVKVSYVLRDSEHFPFPGHIVIGFENPNVQRLEAELAEVRTVQGAWHSVFGSSQLTHASDNFESTKRRAELAEAALKAATEKILLMESVIESVKPQGIEDDKDWPLSRMIRVEDALAALKAQTNGRKA